MEDRPSQLQENTLCSMGNVTTSREALVSAGSPRLRSFTTKVPKKDCTADLKHVVTQWLKCWLSVQMNATIFETGFQKLSGQLRQLKKWNQTSVLWARLPLHSVYVTNYTTKSGQISKKSRSKVTIKLLSCVCLTNDVRIAFNQWM